MESSFFSQIVPFLVFVIFILIHLPVSLCAVNEQYERCGRVVKCGNITIMYPFFATSGRAIRPHYCGAGSYYIFSLYCGADQILTTNMKPYRVLAINYSTHILTITRNDYRNSLCPTNYLNATLINDQNWLDPYDSENMIYMYYGCPSNIRNHANRQFTCAGNTTLGYYLTSYDRDSMDTEACKVSVLIPTSESALQTLYDSPSQDNLIAAIHGGFNFSWSINNRLCSACVESGGRCGSSITTFEREFSCYCPDRPDPLFCGSSSTPNITGSSSSLNITRSSSIPNIKLKLAIGIAAAVAGNMIIVFALCFLRREGILYKPTIFWRKKTKNDLDVDAFIKKNGSLLALKQYRYSNVKKITKSFTDKLGQGGYGCVYKGKLLDGRLVAVKVLNESKGNGEEFLNEVASISRTSHVNVVTLLGFCYERTKRALIYEFMPNGSLDQFIYIGKSSITNSQLEWKTLYQIAIGIARGLEYLHIGCNTRILHFDIKPHNILLDDKFCPKISDFGLAKLCERNDSIISMQGARGTAGYIAPEVFNRHFGGVSYKSDVYSYGMMVLEIVGGRRNIEVGVSHISEIYFPHWIFKYLEPASTELRLNRVITEEEEEELARKMILVGLWCIQTKPSDRPSMTKVVEMLEGSIQSIQIPPKPFLSSPPRSLPQHSSSVSVLEPSSNIS